MESVDLWAKSEENGCAVNECYGVSAYVTPRPDFGVTHWS